MRQLLGMSAYPILVLSGWTALAAQTVKVSPGYEWQDIETFPPSANVAGILPLAGDRGTVIFAESAVRLTSSGGEQVLTRFEESVFGSFVVLGPDGDALIVGESTTGSIYEVPLSGGSRSLIDSIHFNYALALDSTGHGYVSALGSDQNIIYLLDRDPENENRPIVTNIPGFSGPLAFDAAGDLYYGTATLDSTTLETLYRITPEQLAAARTGAPVDLVNDAEDILTEVPGFNQMTYVDGRLVFSDLGFSSPDLLGRLWQVDLAANFALSELVAFRGDQNVLSPSVLGFDPGTQPFFPGSGAAGGRLLVAYSDFATTSKIGALTPEPPFTRGEINGDGKIDVSDAIALLNYLFNGGPPPDPLAAGDVNADGVMDISDGIYLLAHLFGGGPPPQ